MIDDEEMMDNAQQVCDVFIHNRLESTSHTVQWLPYSHDDEDYPQFTKKYFLLGTHQDEGNGKEDELYVASVSVPKLSGE